MWSGVLSIVFEHHHPSELKLFQIDIPFHMRVFMELVSPASWLYNTLVLLCSEYGNRYAEGLSGERYHSQWLLDRISRLSSTPYLILGVQRFQKKTKPFRFVWHDWLLKDFLTCWRSLFSFPFVITPPPFLAFQMTFSERPLHSCYSFFSCLIMFQDERHIQKYLKHVYS